jgi:hypothetical protein
MEITTLQRKIELSMSGVSRNSIFRATTSNARILRRAFKLNASIGAIALFFLSVNLFALDFTFVDHVPDAVPLKAQMSGEIVAGDTEKFLSFIRQEPTNAYAGLGVIFLSSVGGDALEAIKLATELKKIYPKIFVRGTCASSCVVLWLAGSYHGIEKDGKVGIHRPTFASQVLRETSVRQLEVQYEKNVAKFKEYVLSQGMPLSIFEKLMAIPSGEIYWLKDADIKLIGDTPPYFEEKQNALCGPLTREYVSSQTEDNFKKLNACLFAIAKKEKLEYIDSVMGKIKNNRWEQAKKAIAGK